MPLGDTQIRMVVSMFQIRRIFDDILPRNRHALEQIQEILRSRFRGLSQANIAKIPDLLRNPFKYDFRSILYVTEIQASGKVRRFAHERGEGNGAGFNVNYPLTEQIDAKTYLETLSRALSHIGHFRPRYLVVCLGLDTAKGDPTGSWKSIVIRGRGSQFILKDFPGAFHVLIVAPIEVRVKRVMESLKLNEEGARKEIARFDDGSREFVKRYFKANIADPINYDIVINTNNLSIEGAASIIVDAAHLLSD